MAQTCIAARLSASVAESERTDGCARRKGAYHRSGDEELMDGTLVTLGGNTLNLSRRELRDASGAIVELRPQTLDVLLLLARHAGDVVTKDELLESVWSGVVVTEDSLVKCIGEIRRALGDDEHRIVRTEPKRGYRLMSEAASATAAGHEFSQDIRYCTTADGVSIAWASSGEGRPLVRAPHWMTHLHWDWRSSVSGPRIRALSRRFRLVRYDSRGYGLSQADAVPATLDEAVAELEAVVDAAALQRFAMYAPSGGAAIAVRYAAHHPHRVSHLVTMGGFVRGPLKRGADSWPTARFEAFVRLIEDGWGQDNDAFRQMITSLMWPGASAEQMRSFNHLQRVASSPRAAALLVRRIAEFDASADLAQVRCPTLVLHSPHDARVPFAEARLIAASIPGARLEPFDSPNHTPLPDEPAFEQVQRALDEFVRPADGGAQLRVVGS
jgi:pimeloyl-ACP methyl ester carboxylesterase/DNA-binding winged helix-turn-helix (wHTH) protein